MNANFIHRFLAYIIDVFVVLLLASLIQAVYPPSDRAIEIQDKLLAFSKELVSQGSNVKITQEQLIEQQNLQYSLQKETLGLSLVTVVIYMGYFMLYQYYRDGQTIGKKLMKIKIVKNEGKLELNDLIIRSLLINGILYKLIELFLLCVLPKEGFQQISFPLQTCQTIFIIVSGLMVLYRQDKRGLQDLLCKTSVKRTLS